MEESMWRKQRSTFQDHVKYIHNDKIKPFRVGIIQYAECVREMQDQAKYPPPPLMKGKEYYEVDWVVHDKGLSNNEICVTTRDGIPTTIQDEPDNKDKDYHSVHHE